MPTASKPTISTDDLYRMRTVTSARISPDGQQVIYALRRVDRPSEKKYADLWITPTARAAAAPIHLRRPDRRYARLVTRWGADRLSFQPRR